MATRIMFHTLNPTINNIVKELDTAVVHSRAFLELTKEACERGYATESNGYLNGASSGGVIAWCAKIDETLVKARILEMRLTRYIGTNVFIESKIKKIEDYYNESLNIKKNYYN